MLRGFFEITGLMVQNLQIFFLVGQDSVLGPPYLWTVLFGLLFLNKA